MSKELIKQKLIEYLMLYGFEYASFQDETGNRVYFVDYDGTLSFDIPSRFYSIDNRDCFGDYELHIQEGDTSSISEIRLVVYQTIERSLDHESIQCIENVDFLEEIPFAINKVLCSLAYFNFKCEVHSAMVDVVNCINMKSKSKNPNIDSFAIDFINEKIKKFLP
ncbi:MAG: hypothetical protein RLZZ507_1433 [Cyanobacteriota bacterium]|jgi:hypothetical protein